MLYFLEYWQHVTWYREQPITIERLMPDGQCHRYTPDYEIHEGIVKTLAECKPEARLESAHAQQQRQIGQAWAEENGYRFVTFTDSELRAGHQLSNLTLFWRYARQRDSHLHQQIVEQISQTDTSSLDGLCQGLAIPAQVVIPAVCYLLFHHHLEMDLNQPFTAATSLWLAKG